MAPLQTTQNNTSSIGITTGITKPNSPTYSPTIRSRAVPSYSNEVKSKIDSKKLEINQIPSNASIVNDNFMKTRPHVVTRTASPGPRQTIVTAGPRVAEPNYKEDKNLRHHVRTADPPKKSLANKNQFVDVSARREYPLTSSVHQYISKSPKMIKAAAPLSSTPTSTVKPIQVHTNTTTGRVVDPRGITHGVNKSSGNNNNVTLRKAKVTRTSQNPILYSYDYYDTESTSHNTSSSEDEEDSAPFPQIDPSKGDSNHILKRMSDQNIENAIVEQKIIHEELPSFGMRRLFLPLCQVQLHQWKCPAYVKNDDESMDDEFDYVEQTETEVVERLLARALSQPLQAPALPKSSSTVVNSSGLIENSGLVALSRVASHNKHVKIGNKVECVLYDPTLPVDPVMVSSNVKIR